MRISIHLEFVDKLQTVLPMAMNHMLQSFIYSTLPVSSAKRLHDEGFVHGTRRFKLFTFSRLQGRILDDQHIKRAKKLRFDRDVSLIVSSPINWLLRDIASSLLKSETVSLGKNKLYVQGVSIERPHEFEDNHLIKFISPVTVYSTLTREDGKKKTLYYNPNDKEFSKQIESNARKKYELVNKTSADNKNLYIEPVNTNKREHIIKYKDFIIKAWDGIYRLHGSAELIEVIYHAGAGSKNSQGFGCFILYHGDRHA